MNRTKIKLFFCAAFALGLTACSVPDRHIYYWGDYSETAYTYSHTATKEALASHIASLKDIIVHAEEKHKRIPPGICAELGMLTIDTDKDTAKVYFAREKQLFPESSILMDKMIGQLDGEQKQ